MMIKCYDGSIVNSDRVFSFYPRSVDGSWRVSAYVEGSTNEKWTIVTKITEQRAKKIVDDIGHAMNKGVCYFDPLKEE